METRPERAAIDVATMRGLEIGPLASPRIAKSEGPVWYLDHASAPELRHKYAPNQQLGNLAEQICDVDVVQVPGTRLLDAVGELAPFEYVLASHIIEHVPDVIRWLSEIEEVLEPGGILSLIVPDKRYTFDVNRTPTVISDLVDAYLREIRYPTYRQQYDFFAGTVTIDGMVDTPGLWEGTVSYDGVVRSDVSDADIEALRMCVAHRDAPSYVDVHAHVFTPVSFLEIYQKLVRMGLTSFAIASFTPTRLNTLEFYVSLEKCDTHRTPEFVERQLNSIPCIEEPLLKAPPVPEPSVPESGPAGPAAVGRSMEVSLIEQRLIFAKREILQRARRLREWR